MDKTVAAVRLMAVKLVTAVRLFPDAAADAALRDTLALCNQAANQVSAVAFGQHIRSRQALQRKTYRDLKGPPSPPSTSPAK